MDLTIIMTSIGTIASISGVIYTFFRNFKLDTNRRFEEIKNELKYTRSDVRDEFKILREEFKLSKEEYKSIRNEEKEDNLKYRDQVNHMYDKFFSRFDKVDNEIKELRTSTNRLEGAFYNHEYLEVKNNKKTKNKVGNE